MAHILTKTENLDKETAALLADCIGSIPWKRNAAEQKILARSEKVLVPLLNEFQIRIANIRVMHKSNFKFAAVIMSMLSVGVAYLYYQASRIFGTSFNVWYLFFPTMFMPLFSVLSSSMYNQDTQIMNFANFIAHFNDIRVIGPLAEVIWTKNSGYTRIIYNKYAKIEDALIKTLPKITDETGIQLTPNQVNCLVKSLKMKNNNLKIAILYAMPFVGNKAALDAVQRLANHPNFNTNQAVLEAVKKCLPVLEARVTRLNISETLLRPSAIEIKNDTLLRLSSNSSETHPEELLRSSNK